MSDNFFVNQTAYMTAAVMALTVGLGVGLLHIGSTLQKIETKAFFVSIGGAMTICSLFGAYMFVTHDDFEIFFVVFWGLMGLMAYAIPVGLVKIGTDVCRAFTRKTSTTLASSPSRG